MPSLILEDAAINIKISTDAFNGTTPTFTGNAVNIIAKAKRIELVETTESANVAGASGSERHRFHSNKRMLTLNGVVESTGTLFAAGLSSVLRKNIEVVYLPNSTLTGGWTRTGVITKFTTSGSQGEVLTEEIEIDLNADYPPVA